MIEDHEIKNRELCEIIQKRISEINKRYRAGPSLYFYKKAFRFRATSPNIESFLGCDYNIEILYATLVSWDMNSRGAKMKNFDDFKGNITSCLPQFIELEEMVKPQSIDYQKILYLLIKLYRILDLMISDAKLVSNSKLLHFLFPTICMPIDRENTLNYFYGTQSESEKRYTEITLFTFDIIKNNQNFQQYLDKNWNTSIPKLIDNAIILKSLDAKKGI
jgi:hypothetical protein